MGHYHETFVGKGENRKEAEINMMHDFYFEHGHRCSITEIEAARLVRKDPPMKTIERIEQRQDWATPYRRMVDMTIISSEPDLSAPPEDWLEVWEFDIDYHA